MDILTVIQSVGFPISMVIALGIYAKDFINKVMEDNRNREAQLIEVNNKLSDSLAVIADTIESTTVQLNRLCDKMDALENKVDALEKKSQI